MIQKKNVELKIAFDGYWINIHPGLQHTLIGDLTLSNQFEALVGFNENGTYVPLAAKSWAVSDDFTKFNFTIDTSRKFSDGVSLSALHFKNSWETSLKLEPKSSNSSLLDVLYKVEGFADFQKTGTLSGVKVIGDDQLEIKFSSPFRMALDELSANRFAAYRELDKKFVGTGPYVMAEAGQHILKLVPNEYFIPKASAPILLSTVSARDAVRDLVDGKLDAVGYSMGAMISKDLENESSLSTVIGQDALHRALYMNGQKGRFFARREHRLALQYLVTEYIRQNPETLGNPTYTSLDAQVYLPFQAGRIEANEAQAILDSGKRFVPELLEAARKNPPVLIETDTFSIKSVLSAIGLEISPSSRVVPKSEIVDIIYRGTDADLIPGSFGVANGDPDGIYHKLGRTGAIASPMTNNVSVATLLEEGRKIIDKNQLNEFYQRVSRTVLDEAPFVHMGFNKAVAIYRNDKIEVSGRILRRNEGHLQIFEAK